MVTMSDGVPKSGEGGYAYGEKPVASVRQKSKSGRKEVVDEIVHEYPAD